LEESEDQPETRLSDIGKYPINDDSNNQASLQAKQRILVLYSHH
jgi:hypothetical protein